MARDINTKTAQVHDVIIAGIPLKLKSEKDYEAVNKLVSYIDKKITDALPATKNGSIQNAALLALLNMAEEYFELKAAALTKLEKFERKTLKLIEEVESSAKAPARSEKSAAAGLDN